MTSKTTTSLEDVRLIFVRPSETGILKDYIYKLYKDDGDYDSLVNIENGVNSLFRNPELAIPFFIYLGDLRVGYVLLIKYPSVEKGGLTIFIDEFFVESPYRKKGIGTAILGDIKRIAKEMGVKNLWVQAEVYNENAHRFFEREGFVKSPFHNYEYPV